jgi:putative ABC transport system permease protein
LSYFICTTFPAGLTEFLGTPELSPGLAALTAGILGFVGLLAGYFPARDAAMLDPVKAMKV